MLRFRLVKDGVDLEHFVQKFGIEADQVFGNKIKSLLQKGLIENDQTQNGLRLTQRGILMGNQVFIEFVGDD